MKREYDNKCSICAPYYCTCWGKGRKTKPSLAPEIIKRKMLSMERESFLEEMEMEVGFLTCYEWESEYPREERDRICLLQKESLVLHAERKIENFFLIKKNQICEAIICSVSEKENVCFEACLCEVAEENLVEQVREVVSLGELEEGECEIVVEEKNKKQEFYMGPGKKEEEGSCPKEKNKKDLSRNFQGRDTYFKRGGIHEEKRNEFLGEVVFQEDFQLNLKIYCETVSRKEELEKMEILELKGLSFEQEIRLRSEEKNRRLIFLIPDLMLKEELGFIKNLRAENKVPDMRHIYYGVTGYDYEKRENLNIIRSLEAYVETERLFFFRFQSSRQRSIRAYLDFVESFDLSYGSYQRLFEVVYKISEYFRTVLDFEIRKSVISRKVIIDDDLLSYSCVLYVDREQNFKIIQDISRMVFYFPEGSPVMGGDYYGRGILNLEVHRGRGIPFGEYEWLRCYGDVKGFLEIELKTRSFICSNYVSKSIVRNSLFFKKTRYKDLLSIFGGSLKSGD